jgi:hypothetical protein
VKQTLHGLLIPEVKQMTQSLKRPICAVFAAAVVLAVPSLTAQADEALLTDFRGRPPFKRQRVSSDEIADLARFEESSAQPTSGYVRVVNFRGRPPYRRQTIAAEELADLARFEETPADSESRRTRRGPPGKQWWRR